MKFIAHLNPAKTYYINDWEFTGRIKYEKYSYRVDMSLEIAYTEKVIKNESLLQNFLWFLNILEPKIIEIPHTKWVDEKAVYLTEVPETVIVECN